MVLREEVKRILQDNATHLTTPAWIGFQIGDQVTLTLSGDYRLSIFVQRTNTTYTFNQSLPAAEYYLNIGLLNHGDSLEILCSS